jgi:exodeoxyribonuclease VII large subunit
MRNVYTVKQINAYIKNMFNQDFMLNRIYIKGEVSNCKYHTSGHIYFSLKDESGMITCVMFAGSRSGLSFRMQEGQQIIALGSISVYERDGKYQFYAKEIILDGAGQLYEKFEALKRELEEMGMFAPEYKQPIPKYIKTLGVVTAPTGAAVRDIITVAARRNPYVQLILYPALVQGEGAAESIVRGIKMLEKKGTDVIIVGRGGGSIEDLWAFNEETVARAIFDCSVPVISAVGHETDTTIADYVADLRAPTPSAAAELAVYEYLVTAKIKGEYEDRIRKILIQKISHERLRSEQIALKLKFSHPRRKLIEKRQRCADLEQRFRSYIENRLYNSKHRLAIYAEQLKGLSPLEKLSQGYSYVEGSKGENLKSVKQTNRGDLVMIYMTDGYIRAEVKEITEVEPDGKAGK